MKSKLPYLITILFCLFSLYGRANQSEIPDPYIQSKIDSINSYYDKVEDAKALNLAQQFFDAYKNNDHPKVKALSHFLLARSKGTQLDYQVILQLLQSKEFQENKSTLDEKDQIAALNLQANTLVNIGQYAEAQEILFQLLLFLGDSGKSLEKGSAYRSIGNTEFYLQDFNKAIEYYNLALENFLEIRDTTNIAIAYDALGCASTEAGNPRKGIEYSSKALEVITPHKEKSSYLYTNIHVNLGNSHFKSGNADKGIELLEKAKAMGEEINNSLVKADANLYLSDIYQSKGNIEKAGFHLEQAIEISEEGGYVSRLEIIYENASKHFQRIGQMDKAFDNLLKLEKIRREQYQEDKERQIALLQTQYETEQERNQNALLKADLERKRLQNLLLLFSALILLLTAAGIFWAYRQKQHNNEKLKITVEEKTAELIKANEELKEYNEELEHFNYITSHDLKEPLRTIMSFTQLLKKKNQDKLDAESSEYLDFIEKGTNQMNDLVNGILQFTLIKDAETDSTPVDLNQIIEKIEESLDLEKASIEKSSLPTINSSPYLMFYIFKTLIDNGLQYNEDSSPKVWVDYKANGTMHQIIIKDNGIGIDEAYQEKIFSMLSAFILEMNTKALAWAYLSLKNASIN